MIRTGMRITTDPMRIRVAITRGMMLLAVAAICATLLQAQSARLVGAITAINGNTITVKTDAGEQTQVTVPDDATLKRLEPGQKDLNAAPAIPLTDLAVGDRVLVRLDASASTPTASLVVAMKQADVAQVHQKDSEAWQRGVAGLVKQVDPASGAITVTTGAGPTAKTVTVKTTGSSKLLRYAPNSVRFDDAKPAPIGEIKPGDQLRARGAKNAGGTEITAEAVVSGTFRNIAGIVSAVDAGASTVTVKDLATKKSITIHIAPDIPLRRIPDTMAKALAARLKANGEGSFAPGGARNGNGGDSAHAAAPPASAGAGAPGAATGHWGGPAGGQQGGGDLQRMLANAPAIKISDLQKGEAIMVVSTNGDGDVNAVTLLAGVAPLLEAPAATDLLSNWSMGGGGEASAGTP